MQAKNSETFAFLKGRYPVRRVRKAIIDLNAVKVADLARRHGINEQTMYLTANGHRRNKAAMEALSATLGLPMDELFESKNQSQERE